ncbi:hypothetical protein QTP86_005277 [Hemibagrus guttatus]|nr:hypothetical protein QTP86_005277 [Hemibagrus guttatus]
MDIEGSSAEIVKSTKFLGVYLLENFTWSLKTSSINRKAQQHLPPTILTVFYRRTIESILSSCITAWFGNCTVLDHKNLQRIVRTAEKIIGVSLLHHDYSTDETDKGVSKEAESLLWGIGGSVVGFSQIMRKARVRFPPTGGSADPKPGKMGGLRQEGHPA